MVAHDFRQLQSWRLSLSNLAVDGITAVDLDEVENVLRKTTDLRLTRIIPDGT